MCHLDRQITLLLERGIWESRFPARATANLSENGQTVRVFPAVSPGFPFVPIPWLW